MKDMIVVIAVVIAFASFFTAHVAITYGLVFRHPRWRAPVGFFVRLSDSTGRGAST